VAELPKLAKRIPSSSIGSTIKKAGFSAQHEKQAMTLNG
jgi:hypothetical protein